MDKQLRALAYSIIETGDIDEKKLAALVAKLPKKDLQTFLFHLKNALAKNTVTVTTATEPSTTLQKHFEETFKNKTVQFVTDTNVGAGVIVKIGDDVYDYSVQNYIAATIDAVQKEL